MPTFDTAMHLRPIQLGDAQRIHEWASQPAACRFQPWGPNSEADTAAFVQEAVRTWEDRSEARRVWVAELPGEGVVGLGELVNVSRSTREIAYAVHVKHWGRGVGTQIGALLIDRAFADPAVERVQATCDPRNVGSATILERLGMTLKGTLRHTLFVRDGWRDSRMYALLRGEVQA